MTDLEIVEEKPQDTVFFLFGEINDEQSEAVCEWIIACNTAEVEPRSMTIFIKSEGGTLDGAFAVIEMMRASRIPIRTVALGQIASAALMIFTAGSTRIVTQTCSIMAHNYSTSISGPHAQLMGVYKELKSMDSRIVEHFLTCSPELKPRDVRKHLITSVDSYLSPDQLVELGLADEVGPVQFPDNLETKKGKK